MGLSTREVNEWHRRYCEVTPWLAISGDLSEHRSRAVAQLEDWVAHGITDIIDVRGEWSDESLVAQVAPQIRYHHLGTHDDGIAQDIEWFEQGLSALRKALSFPEPKLMIHCHMGINRGPSMAYAMLLAQGWNPVDALEAIRIARPIAGIIYAEDAWRALVSLGIIEDSPYSVPPEIPKWFSENEIDVHSIIRKIRKAS